jgi:hypothetical protein
MRTWTRLVPAVLLALPFTMASVRAEDAESNAKKIEQLQKDLKELRLTLDVLKEEMKTNSVRGAKVEADLSLIKDMLLKAASARDAAVRQVNYAPLPPEELREIRDLLHRIASMQEANIRRSAYAPTPTTEDVPPGGTPVPATGTITLRNQYTAMAIVRINGRRFEVPPGRNAVIPGVPVGPYNYDVEVDGYGVVMPLRTETLRPNGRIITIYPQ